jgi:hypothetical protein
MAADDPDDSKDGHDAGLVCRHFELVHDTARFLHRPINLHSFDTQLQRLGTWTVGPSEYSSKAYRTYQGRCWSRYHH